jgi:ribulose 1,5-bisphosphate carboxylase large subunit-like protein
MSSERVTPAHLARRALIYVRQSTVDQVVNNLESQRRQYALAERAVELGAKALMLNVFAQGLDALRLLRQAELGVPVFAHRVGAALLIRGERVGVSGRVLTELTRLCGADYVQAGSLSGTVFDSEEDVRAQVQACHRELAGACRSVAVLGGGVGPENAVDQVRRCGADSGVMVLLGSAAYRHPGGAEAGVRATIEALRG